MADVGVVDSENACIPVWVGIVILFVIFWRKNHNIGVVRKARVERILFPSQVISSVVYAKDFVAVNDIIVDDYCTALR